MNEIERNKLLFLLIEKLSKEKDFQTIKLIESLIVNDTIAMRKTFEIMTRDLNMPT